MIAKVTYNMRQDETEIIINVMGRSLFFILKKKYVESDHYHNMLKSNVKLE